MRISDWSSDVCSSDLIDFWGKNRAALKAATSEACAAEADVAAARLMISTAIASSYADLARLYADRDVLAATATVREHRLRPVRARTDPCLDSDAHLPQPASGPPASPAHLSPTVEPLQFVL